MRPKGLRLGAQLPEQRGNPRRILLGGGCHVCLLCGRDRVEYREETIYPIAQLPLTPVDLSDLTRDGPAHKSRTGSTPEKNNDEDDTPRAAPHVNIDRIPKVSSVRSIVPLKLDADPVRVE